MGREFWNAVEENPIIAAVKSMDDLEQCCKLEDIRVVFILFYFMVTFIFFVCSMVHKNINICIYDRVANKGESEGEVRPSQL